MYPLKGDEYPLQEFAAHADAVVLAGKIQPDQTLLPRPLGKAHADLAALLGVLHRVANNVHQDLPQAEGVSHQAFLQNPSDLKAERLFLLHRLRPDNNRQIVNQVRQREALLVDNHPPAVDPGHVQHVVDQTHQVDRGSADLI